MFPAIVRRSPYGVSSATVPSGCHVGGAIGQGQRAGHGRFSHVSTSEVAFRRPPVRSREHSHVLPCLGVPGQQRGAGQLQGESSPQTTLIRPSFLAASPPPARYPIRHLPLSWLGRKPLLSFPQGARAAGGMAARAVGSPVSGRRADKKELTRCSGVSATRSRRFL